MEDNRVDLFSKCKNEQIRRWSIWSEEDYIYMDYGVLGGETQTDNEHIPMGLSTRTLEEQIQSRINSRVNKKIDQGYVHSIEDARNNIRTNALGYPRSSKCKAFNKVKNFPYGKVYSQRKLDGHHCTIINDDGTYVAYSSSGKIIDTIPEILASIEIPVGRLIEGELYHHGTILQTISSWVKRRQENTLKLKFVVYEVNLSDVGYGERLRFLNNLKIHNKNFVEIHKTDLLIGEFNVLPLIKQEVEKGYEGLVLRPDDNSYASFEKTDACIKVKPIHFKGEFAIDDEFLVVRILSSKDGWAILVCVTDKGKEFRVSAPGSMPEKTEVLRNKENYIHKHVEIEFAGWTKRKVPQHPVALRWREKFEE